MITKKNQEITRKHLERYRPKTRSLVTDSQYRPFGHFRSSAKFIQSNNTTVSNAKVSCLLNLKNYYLRKLRIMYRLTVYQK